jgi:hypothetical protein
MMLARPLDSFRFAPAGERLPVGTGGLGVFMVSEQRSITVYSFRLYGCQVESPHVPGYKATVQAIERMGGEALRGTAQNVPDEALDDNGCYRRINTGWGALG